MDKTLRLLEMGFSENEVSSAFERFGEQFVNDVYESIEVNSKAMINMFNLEKKGFEKTLSML